MGESEEENKQDVLAKPQDQQSAAPAPSPEAEQTTPREETLAQAKKFLQDAEVQNTTPERKAEFLKSKGLADSDIEGLLNEVTQDGRQESQPSIPEERIEPPLSKKEDRPPIVTYPEFLTKPERPPPLVTVNRFLNTLYAFGGLSTIVYGASKFVVEPMVHTLTEARISLHDTANQDLAKLVAKLETVVSEIPEPKPKDAKATEKHTDDDVVSSYDDPTELFHRDIGIQTSLPSSPNPQYAQQQQQKEAPTTHQSQRLARLTAALQSLNESVGEQTETLGDVHTVMDVLQQDVDKLNAAAATDFVGNYSMYGGPNKNEPDDEIKRAKENIRRVKGALLSTRSFPAGGR
ncbi:peroxisomal membrane anchor protein conserved region-domain-containing protein [Chaetomium tenue]|uniref:Peroxisomal membrane anchor protein conserved region-domain-containing protein n=1 Tax=Chaetomium tenue TaxID=1854479 RepID=A0ACB7PGI5_9PEZI|nr:peroxisomal membrane anchor protein conserved region-domain-containing protein [Chaetomium globosum]